MTNKEKIRKVLLVEPEKKPRVVEIDDTLEALQELVGGYIEAIYPFEDEVALICNEEGKITGLPLNRALYSYEGEMYEIIAGNFFIIGAPEDSEDFTSLTEEQIEKYTEYFKVIEVYTQTQFGLVVEQRI
ncbi:MAG: DUF3846 domain-containing protein [Ruminococcus sp.]|nr:DUF3846 domain-containing protein [Ruminococcus sp.]MBQ4129610.1 DUF3846 domain-containing protein [Ruminococcus sp.]